MTPAHNTIEIAPQIYVSNEQSEPSNQNNKPSNAITEDTICMDAFENEDNTRG